MGIAFETALEALRREGMDDPPREALATAIIGLAQAGERDPDRLCDAAVEACHRAVISDPNPPPSAASQEPQGS